MSSMAHSKAHLRGLLILAPNTSLGNAKTAQQVLVLFSGADRGPRSGTVTAPEKETEQKNERKEQTNEKQTRQTKTQWGKTIHALCTDSVFYYFIFFSLAPENNTRTC